MRPGQERFKILLEETITGLCKSDLDYRHELKIQGLLAITVDDESVFVVQFDQKYYHAHEPHPIHHEHQNSNAITESKLVHSESTFQHQPPGPPAHVTSFIDGHSEVAHINSSRAIHPGIPQQVLRERPRSKLARPVPYQHPRLEALVEASRHTHSASPDIEVVNDSTGPTTAFQPSGGHDTNHELLDQNAVNALRLQMSAQGYATDAALSLNRRSSLSLRGPPTPTFTPTSCPTPTAELLANVVLRHKQDHTDDLLHDQVHIIQMSSPTSMPPTLPQPTILTKGAQKRFDSSIFAGQLFALDNRGHAASVSSAHSVPGPGFRPPICSPGTVYTNSVHRDISVPSTSSSPVNLPVTAWTTLPNPGLLAPSSTTLTSPLTLIQSHSLTEDLARRDLPYILSAPQALQLSQSEPRGHCESLSNTLHHCHSPQPHSLTEQRQPPPAHSNRNPSPINIRPLHKTLQGVSSEDNMPGTPPLARATPPTTNSTPSSTPTPKSPPQQQQQEHWYKRSRHSSSHSSKPDKTVVSKDVVCLPYEYLREQEDKGLMVLPRRDVRAALADHGLTATIQLTSNSTPKEIRSKISSAFTEVFRLDEDEELEFTFLSCVPGTRKLQRVSLTSKDKAEKWFGARVMQMAGQGILYIVSDEKYKERLQLLQ